jgi:cytochrome c oxidase subunit II
MRKQPSQHPIAQMVAIVVIASAIGIAIAAAIHWFPPAASTQAKKVDTLYHVLVYVSIPVFVIVETVLLYSVWRFRMRPGQENEDGAPIHGNTRIEIVWTVIPAVLLLSLCSYAFVVLRQIERKHKNELIVNVTGQQFEWSYDYPGQAGKTVPAAQLYLPNDRPVLFKIHSKDVIHSFWIPAFRVKIAAVPGITTTVRATPTRLGVYPIVCAELCGLGHATMRSTLHVMPAAKFNAWIARGGQPGGVAGAAAGGGSGGGTSAAGDPAALGKTTFAGAGGCVACHTLADAASTGTTGPDLDKALKGKNAAFIRQSIVQPNAVIAPGYGPGIMPQNFSQTLSAPQIDGLVAYLAKVTK